VGHDQERFTRYARGLEKVVGRLIDCKTKEKRAAHIDQQKNVARELKDVLRTIESAQNAVAGELAKGGNLPYAYNQLQAAQQKLKRAIRDLG
jgi:hypothetical protein